MALKLLEGEKNETDLSSSNWNSPSQCLIVCNYLYDSLGTQLNERAIVSW